MTFFGDDHPDLMSIGDALQRRLDRVLETEQEAAAVMARRTAVLRDRLLEAEDAGDAVEVVTASGHRVSGSVATVAMDHVEIRGGHTATLVVFDQIAVVEVS